MKKKTENYSKSKIMGIDVVLLIILVFLALQVVIPLVHVIAMSFSTQKEYLDTPLLLVPVRPTLDAYRALFADGRIWIGYRSTLTLVLLGVPVNMLLTTTLAYALSRGNFPGRKALMYLIVYHAVSGRHYSAVPHYEDLQADRQLLVVRIRYGH